jgi:hypothetical protein
VGGENDALAKGDEGHLLEAREARDPCAFAVVGLGRHRSPAGHEVGGDQRRQRPEPPLGPPRIDGALGLQRRGDAHGASPSSARCLSTSASSSAALALKYASRPAMMRLPCSPSISVLAIIDVILAIASRASWALFGGSRSIG